MRDTPSLDTHSTEANEEQTFSVPSRIGRHVLLRPVQVEDYAFLQQAEADPRLAQQWRLRGQTPSPEHWAQLLWQGVFAQFLVVERTTSLPVGLVMAYGADFQNGYAYVGATKLDLDHQTPLVMLGLFLFFEHVFWTWPFRKLYFESPEYNLPQFRHALKHLVRAEGRLGQHTYFGGRYWDELILALYRDDWEEAAPRLLAIERLAAEESVPFDERAVPGQADGNT